MQIIGEWFKNDSRAANKSNLNDTTTCKRLKATTKTKNCRMAAERPTAKTKNFEVNHQNVASKMPIKVKKQLTDQLTGLIQEQLLKVLAIRLGSIFKLQEFAFTAPSSTIQRVREKYPEYLRR